MPPPLRLTLTDYLDPTRWRWVLHDSGGHWTDCRKLKLCNDGSVSHALRTWQLAGAKNCAVDNARIQKKLRVERD